MAKCQLVISSGELSYNQKVPACELSQCPHVVAIGATYTATYTPRTHTHLFPVKQSPKTLLSITNKCVVVPQVSRPALRPLESRPALHGAGGPALEVAERSDSLHT